MALPTSGPISLRDVNEELGKDSTDTVSLNDSDVRSLAGISSGEISLEDLRGKSSVFELTIDSNTTNLNLRNAALNSGWNGQAEVIATIGNGVRISGSSGGNSTPALLIEGSWPKGITLINNGIIVGRGGQGGNGCDATAFVSSGGTPSVSTSGGSAGGGGGRALQVTTSCTINNLGTIAGGGGGGGGGGSAARAQISSHAAASAGGGGGGGASSDITSLGGSRGSASANTPARPSGNAISRGGNGNSGTFNNRGSGGARPNTADAEGVVTARGAAGGNGGNWGLSGSSGNSDAFTTGFDSENLSPSSTRNGRSGGSRGKAIDGNNNINWINTGTRLGEIAP